jgi:hypothetical protein
VALSTEEYHKAERLATLTHDHYTQKALTREQYEIAFNEVGLRDIHFEVKAISPPRPGSGAEGPADSPTSIAAPANPAGHLAQDDIYKATGAGGQPTLR